MTDNEIMTTLRRCADRACYRCTEYGKEYCRETIAALAWNLMYNQKAEIERLKEFECKQSKNVIELPCKVGDTMYVDYKGIAYPVKVNAIRIDTKKNNHRICVSGTFHLYEYYDHNYKATFPFDSIGKSLFYTEAEAKMKGGERDDQ